MKKNWIIGFLGIAIVLFGYAGFPLVVKSVSIIAIGLIISFISFRTIIKDKIALKVTKNDEPQKTEETAN